MLDSYVLDTFALLAYLLPETGRDRVEELLKDATSGHARLLFCIINYGEALHILERTRPQTKVEEVVGVIDNLPLEIVEADRWLTFAAAHVKAQHPLSYADAFAVALAQRESAAVVTGNPEFATVEGLVKVEWLARPGPKRI